MPRSRRGRRSFSPFRRWRDPLRAIPRGRVRPPRAARQSGVTVFFASYVPFSKEVGKVNREPVALLRVERTGVPIERKLHPGLDPDRTIHPEYARTEKELLSST